MKQEAEKRPGRETDVESKKMKGERLHFLHNVTETMKKTWNGKQAKRNRN